MEGWMNCKACKCSECKSKNVQHREDAHGDFEHRCLDCFRGWWVEGPDS